VPYRLLAVAGGCSTVLAAAATLAAMAWHRATLAPVTMMIQADEFREWRGVAALGLRIANTSGVDVDGLRLRVTTLDRDGLPLGEAEVDLRRLAAHAYTSKLARFPEVDPAMIASWTAEPAPTWLPGRRIEIETVAGPPAG